MTKYRIVPKRDFGGKPFLINGERVMSGFVVTDGFCNVMPGACWFQTIPEALHAIGVLMVTGNTPRFWTVLRQTDSAA